MSTATPETIRDDGVLVPWGRWHALRTTAAALQATGESLREQLGAPGRVTKRSRLIDATVRQLREQAARLDQYLGLVPPTCPKCDEQVFIRRGGEARKKARFRVHEQRLKLSREVCEAAEALPVAHQTPQLRRAVARFREHLAVGRVPFPRLPDDDTALPTEATA